MTNRSKHDTARQAAFDATGPFLIEVTNRLRAAAGSGQVTVDISDLLPPGRNCAASSPAGSPGVTAGCEVRYGLCGWSRQAPSRQSMRQRLRPAETRRCP